jgi:hypothetical protein
MLYNSSQSICRKSLCSHQSLLRAFYARLEGCRELCKSEADSKEKHGVWDPMSEWTLTSPNVHSRVDSNTFTTNNPMPESTFNLCQSRLYHQLGTLDFASVFLVLLSPPFPLFSFWIQKTKYSVYTSTYCTILCVHCGVNCTIINTHRVICHLQRRADTEAELLDEIQPKVVKSFPPCYSQSPLQLCLRFLFLQITQPLTVSVKEKGGIPDRKPFPPFLWFKKSIQIRYLMSENSQDYAQKPQHDCAFMNSATENLEVQDRSSLHLNCFQWIIYLLRGFCCTQRKLAPQLYMLDGNSPNPTLPSSPACISWCTTRVYNYNLGSFSDDEKAFVLVSTSC